MRIETALSVRQPWAWLILNAGKTHENRTWPARFRGWCLLHASKGMTVAEYEDAQGFAHSIDARLTFPKFHDLARGGIVGAVRIDDCVDYSDSPWFCGPYGFVIGKAVPLPFTPLKGALGFFTIMGSPYYLENGEVVSDLATVGK